MIIRIGLVAALLMPAAAMAQGNPGPYGKLFGRAPASSASQEHTTVEFRSSIGVAFDDALLAPEGSPANTPLQSGPQVGGSAVLSVDHRSSVFTANLSGGAGRGQFYTEPTSYGATQYFAHANLDAKLTTRFEAGATAGYTHSPSYGFFSDFGRPVDPEGGIVNSALPFSPYAAVMAENETIEARAHLKTHITTRSAIDLSAHQFQTRFPQQPLSDIASTGYLATWQWQLRRDLSVHAGYGQDHVDLRAPDRVDYDAGLLDVGVDFNREFSVARRTTLRFNTSTLLLKRDGYEGELRFNGIVTLSKHFRRTWEAMIQASRATSYVAGFTEPLYTDNVGASLEGMLSTRVELISGVSAGRGESSFSHTSGFGTFAGMSQLSIALGRNVSAYGSYVAYWYEAPANAFTLAVPGRMARQMVSVGLNLYVPVYGKVRQGQ